MLGRFFYQFLNTIFQSVSNSFPISPNTLALFIAYMYNRNYAPSTVSSYVSALGYSHKFLGYSDPTKAFFIIQMLKGYNKLGYRLDARLPITLPVLQKLIESSATLSISEFQCCQFRAKCTTAFFAFLRIGEMTYNSAKDASNLILQVQHVSKLVDSSNYVVALKITFGNFKHSYNQRPFTIFLHRQNSCCPVQFLLEYLAGRGNRPGPLFLNPDNNPVSRKYFADLLSPSRLMGWTPHVIKVIASASVLPHLLQSGECLMLKQGLLVDGSQMPFLNILEYRHFQHNFSFACNSCIACGGGCAWVT